MLRITVRMIQDESFFVKRQNLIFTLENVIDT